jgi:hypothetical protein
VKSWADCNAPSANGECLAVFNVPVPGVSWVSLNRIDEFSDVTGTGPTFAMPVEILGLPATSARRRVQLFVQSMSSGILGTHLATPSRGSSLWSSMALLHNLDASQVFYPWRSPSRTTYDLSLVFSFTFTASPPHPAATPTGTRLLEFVDSESGRALRFNVIAFGTLPDGDGAGIDVKDGVTIVGTTFRQGSAFGRSVQRSRRATPASYQDLRAHVDAFEYRIVRGEFPPSSRGRGRSIRRCRASRTTTSCAATG